VFATRFEPEIAVVEYLGWRSRQSPATTAVGPRYRAPECI
jgi:hypothetical protein